MQRIVHLLTETSDPLADELIAMQRQDPEQEIETFDLRPPAPDYRKLLQEIFRADSITVW